MQQLVYLLLLFAVWLISKGEVNRANGQGGEIGTRDHDGAVFMHLHGEKKYDKHLGHNLRIYKNQSLKFLDPILGCFYLYFDTFWITLFVIYNFLILFLS